MPITMKRPAEKNSEEKTSLSLGIQNQIAGATKLDTTDYTMEDNSRKTVTIAEKNHSKEKQDVINLKYPEGTTQRVKSFYSGVGHNMTSGFLMSFELTMDLLERGIITFSKGGYKIIDQRQER